MARPSAWPWAGCEPAVAAGSPWSSWRRAASSSGVMAVKSTWTASTPPRPITAPRTRVLISFFSGQPGRGQGDHHPDVAAGLGDLLDHPEVDDAAVQLRVLDGAEGLDDLGFGGHSVVLGGSGVGSGARGFPLRGIGRIPR